MFTNHISHNCIHWTLSPAYRSDQKKTEYSYDRPINLSHKYGSYIFIGCRTAGQRCSPIRSVGETVWNIEAWNTKWFAVVGFMTHKTAIPQFLCVIMPSGMITPTKPLVGVFLICSLWTRATRKMEILFPFFYTSIHVFQYCGELKELKFRNA